MVVHQTDSHEHTQQHDTEGKTLRKRKTRSSYRNKSDLRSDSGARHKKKNKKRYVENQKEKFRKSKEWKEFRGRMAKLFNHRDYITGRKLVKGFNVHHLRTEQDAENYCDISNEEEFIPLNSYCHKMLHYLFIFYQKDKTIMNRIREILDKMCDLSVKHGVDPVDLDHCIQDIEETEPQDEYDPEIDGDGGNEERLE